jgi:hypothetical protein
MSCCRTSQNVYDLNFFTAIKGRYFRAFGENNQQTVQRSVLPGPVHHALQQRTCSDFGRPAVVCWVWMRSEIATGTGKVTAALCNLPNWGPRS